MKVFKIYDVGADQSSWCFAWAYKRNPEGFRQFGDGGYTKFIRLWPFKFRYVR